jgi:hypothetical protein
LVPPYVPLVPYIPVVIGRKLFRYWARNYSHTALRHLLVNAHFQIESTDYIWQTFENISGSQPRWIAWTKPALRWLADTLERTPLLRGFGVSQVIVARRADFGRALADPTLAKGIRENGPSPA